MKQFMKQLGMAIALMFASTVLFALPASAEDAATSSLSKYISVVDDYEDKERGAEEEDWDDEADDC